MALANTLAYDNRATILALKIIKYRPPVSCRVPCFYYVSSQELTMSSGLPDLLVGRVSHGDHAGAVELLTDVVLPVCLWVLGRRQ